MYCSTPEDCGRSCFRENTTEMCIDGACACSIPRGRIATNDMRVFWVVLVIMSLFIYWYYHEECQKSNKHTADDRVLRRTNISANDMLAFVPSSTFQGYKKYYIFKKDQKGLGYYKDAYSQNHM